MGCVQNDELGAPAWPSEIFLLVSYSDILLVVSILDVDYECHLRSF